MRSLILCIVLAVGVFAGVHLLSGVTGDVLSSAMLVLTFLVTVMGCFPGLLTSSGRYPNKC